METSDRIRCAGLFPHHSSHPGRLDSEARRRARLRHWPLRGPRGPPGRNGPLGPRFGLFGPEGPSSALHVCARTSLGVRRMGLATLSLRHSQPEWSWKAQSYPWNGDGIIKRGPGTISRCGRHPHQDASRPVEVAPGPPCMTPAHSLERTALSRTIREAVPKAEC